MATLWPRLTTLCLISLSLGIAVFAQSADKPNRRVPKLTSEDLQPSPPVEPATTEPDAPTPARPSPPNNVAAGGPIIWHRDPSEAARLAYAGDRLVVIDVFTDWCGWCKKMDREIYTDRRIAALSREYVFLKLNAEDRGAGQEFARVAGVRGFPTTVILNSKGEVLAAKTGFIPTPEAFLEFVAQARAAQPVRTNGQTR
jgi:thiol-disulfide isomerase/thioredoxin